MNRDELKKWLTDVDTYNHTMEVILNDRMLLKQSITSHLSKYFDFDDIEISTDFSVITLKWDYSKGLVINPSNLEGLDMDFTVSHRYDDRLGDGVIVELYPFGIKEIEE